MKHIIALIIICTLSSATQAQWIQKGLDIDGDWTKDYSGESVSINADGTTLAIGAPLNDGTSTDPLFNNGHTRIYYFSTVGVIENSFGDGLLIYPNPTDAIEFIQ